MSPVSRPSAARPGTGFAREPGSRVSFASCCAPGHEPRAAVDAAAFGPRPTRRHRPPQRQDRAIRRGARAGACHPRRQDRRGRQHRRHPRAGRPQHPCDRSRGPHRHSRPDRFPHPRHPRRAHLQHRGALDRRPHARRCARPYPCRRRTGSEGLLADRRRRLDRASVRGRPPPHPGGDRRRRAGPPCLCADSLFRDSAFARRRRGAGHRQGSGAGVAYHRRERRRRRADRLDQRRQPHHQRRLQSAAAPELRAAGRRHPRVLPRAQRARHHRRARSRRLQHADRGIPAAVPGLARPRADRARRLQPVRAAPRPRARRPHGDDRRDADGVRRRLAALQRHRRERRLGHVQQREADRGGPRAALPRAAMGGAARADRHVPLAQRALGASPARSAGAHQQGDTDRAAALVDRAPQRRARRRASSA